jgi:hypothetical protein
MTAAPAPNAVPMPPAPPPAPKPAQPKPAAPAPANLPMPAARLGDFLMDRARFEIVNARFARGDRRIRDTLLQIEDMVMKNETDGPLVLDEQAAAAHTRSRIDKAYRNVFSDRDLHGPGDGDELITTMAHDFLEMLDPTTLEGFDIADGPTDVPLPPSTFFDGELSLVFGLCRTETRPKTFLGIVDLDDEIKGGGTVMYPATDANPGDVGMPMVNTYQHDFENDGDIDEELRDAPLVLARNIRILPGQTRLRAIFAIVEEDFLPTAVAQALAILFGKLLDIILDAVIQSARASAEAEIRRLLERQGNLDPDQIERAIQAFRDGFNSLEVDKATDAIEDLVVRLLAELFGDDLFNPIEVLGEFVWDDTSKPPFYTLIARGGSSNGIVQAPQVARVSDVVTRQATLLGEPGEYLFDFAFRAQPVRIV